MGLIQPMIMLLVMLLMMTTVMMSVLHDDCDGGDFGYGGGVFPALHN